ncbi:hypothetical protein HHI36_007320 [Cryptolaemus montrouzieri]|uniref:Titin n=1 Tax=Cryptolaemus montrouzieri TaxID=559131 RepID=A0ABD2MP75_9CUCU
MPIEEVSIHAEVKSSSEPIIQPITAVTIETQTGNSLKSQSSEPLRKDFTVTYNQPVDAQTQAQLSQEFIDWEGDTRQRETITISKVVKGDEETIQFATKQMATQDPQPLIEEPDDDLLIEANYKKCTEADSKSTELNITNSKPNQPFETVFVEPDETTTEVIVDADGTKRIIVKKLHRTVVRHQQHVQQQKLTSFSTLTQDNVPISHSFSQVTLQGQQSSTTVARGDGRKETLSNRQFGGKIVTGSSGGDIDVKEFQTEPESHYTVIESQKPDEVEVDGVKLHEGDVTFVDDANKLVSAEQAHVTYENSHIHTSSSSVRAVVQQVTRKVIRKTRRIIRRIVIIDGKEQITEEVVEEPEEVEVTEEGIPRVSINVTRTEDGTTIENQQFEENIQEPIQTTITTVEEEHPVKIVSEPILEISEQRHEEEKERFVPIISPPEIINVESEIQEINVQSPQKSVNEVIEDIENKKTPEMQEIENNILKITEEETVPSAVEGDQRYVVDLSPPPQSAQLVTITTQTSFESHKDIPPSGMAVYKNVEVETSAPIAQTVSIQSPSVEVEPRKENEFPLTDTLLVSEVAQIQPAELEEKIEISVAPNQAPNVKTIQITDDDQKLQKLLTNGSQKSHVQISVHEDVEVSPLESKDVTLTNRKDLKTINMHEITREFITQEQKTDEKGKESEPETIVTTPSQTEKLEKVTPLSPRKNQHQTVEIAVSLEEKPIDWKFETAKISSSITVEKHGITDEEKLQRDIDFTLPSITQIMNVSRPTTRTEEVPSILEPSEHEKSLTPSDIDHGGRKSKRKKKIKTPVEESPITSIQKSPIISVEKSPISPVMKSPVASPDEKEDEIQEKIISEVASIETSLAESTDITIPPDSQELEESPKPTLAPFESLTESDREEKDTGYDADKTTVDESLIEDDDQEKKKRRKKKKRQKVKAKETDESHVPQTVSESSPIGESVVFTDDDIPPTKQVLEEVFPKKKKNKKTKKEEIKEPELEEKPEPIEQQAKDEELESANDSLHTFSTISDVGTVKIIEEKIETPSKEQAGEMSTEIITTVPVLEAVFTQEEPSQTSPVVEEIPAKIVEQIDTKPTSVQTSPEVPIETIEYSVQTDEEPQLEKPEIVESSSQVELYVTEINTQTTPKVASPEPIAPELTETSIQTTTPDKIEVNEEFAQTDEIVLPEPEVVERVDSGMQTHQPCLSVEEVQTSPTEIAKVETVEAEMQAQPSPDIHSVQTSPLPSAPPVEDAATETDKETLSPQLSEEKIPVAETTENATQVQPTPEDHSAQTSPLPLAPTTEDASVETEVDYVPPQIREIVEKMETLTQTSPTPSAIAQLTPPSSPSEYEVLVEAAISIPTHSKESGKSVWMNTEPTEDQGIEIEEKPLSGDVAVEVSVDDLVLKKYSTITDFLDNERSDMENQKSETPSEGLVISSVVTDMNEEKVNEIKKRQKLLNNLKKHQYKSQ